MVFNMATDPAAADESIGEELHDESMDVGEAGTDEPNNESIDLTQSGEAENDEREDIASKTSTPESSTIQSSRQTTTLRNESMGSIKDGQKDQSQLLEASITTTITTTIKMMMRKTKKKFRKSTSMVDLSNRYISHPTGCTWPLSGVEGISIPSSTRSCTKHRVSMVIIIPIQAVVPVVPLVLLLERQHHLAAAVTVISVTVMNKAKTPLQKYQ